MKPSCHNAMQSLLAQIRRTLPFELDPSQLCNGPCQGCPKKLLEFIDMELCEWEQRLAVGEEPTFGDLHKLAKRAKKIHRVLDNNGLIASN